MSSTRSKNTSGNYYLEQRDTALLVNYDHYKLYANPTIEAFPTLGIRPTHMSRDTLAYNGIDIESALFGINSTNLVPPIKSPRKIISSVKPVRSIPLKIVEVLIQEAGTFVILKAHARIFLWI